MKLSFLFCLFVGIAPLTAFAEDNVAVQDASAALKEAELQRPELKIPTQDVADRPGQVVEIYNTFNASGEPVLIERKPSDAAEPVVHPED